MHCSHHMKDSCARYWQAMFGTALRHHWTSQDGQTWDSGLSHDHDVIKWKHFPRYWPFVRGLRSPVNSPHKGQRRGALMFSLICAWINAWVNNREAGDLIRYRAHCDVTVMYSCYFPPPMYQHGWSECHQIWEISIEDTIKLWRPYIQAKYAF